MDVLLSTRKDLVDYAPSMEHQAANMAYSVQGCYKSNDAEAAATLTVTAWNINCLTGHKARLVGRLMQQDRCDVLIMVDSRHSSCTARSFKKIFVCCLVHKLTFRMIQIVSLGNLEVLYSLLVPNGALVMRLSQADQTIRDKGYLLASDFAPALALFISWEPIGHLFPHLLYQQ